MTYLPRRLRKPNSHPGRIIRVYNDRLSVDELAAIKARYLATRKGGPVFQVPIVESVQTTYGRTGAGVIVWALAALLLLAAIVWWAA